jgi:hypothetical protein
LKKERYRDNKISKEQIINREVRGTKKEKTRKEEKNRKKK